METTTELTKEQYQKLQEVRDTPWDKATTDQKIEKLKISIIDFRYLTNRIMNLENIIRTLKKHSHDTNGNILIPLNEGSSSQGLVGGASATRNILG